MSEDEEEFENIETFAWKNGFRRMTVTMASNHFKINKTQPLACLIGLSEKHLEKVREDPSLLEYNATVSFSGALHCISGEHVAKHPTWLSGAFNFGESLMQMHWVLTGDVRVEKNRLCAIEFNSNEIDIVQPEGMLETSPDPSMFEFESIWIKEADAPRQYPRRKRKAKKFIDDE